ncbi:hypothetical protein H2200_000994 [Cladophialophora chaetospira]|uniref:Uncharacterized protein n=1 Tax=Cladophialophora chaetospira TaxID=386627 RepID=A0AA39CRI8_9EURO|nr:hypothetical protein H2200_000994 [Cladophialophora chaetospira]
MGRWGHRMFEGDQDMDIEGQIISEIQKKVKARGVYMEDEHMFDLFYNLEEPDYRPTRFSITSRELRGHIKSMSGQLLKQYRTNPDASYGQYATIVLSAVMMKTGCKISEENRTFLRQAAHGTSSRSSRSWFALFSGDIGFRDPGKAQFLSALDNYKNGKPRDFRAPRSVAEQGPPAGEGED